MVQPLSSPAIAKLNQLAHKNIVQRSDSSEINEGYEKSEVEEEKETKS